MLMLLGILASVPPSLDVNLKALPPICIPQVKDCSEGLIRGKGMDGTYCYDNEFNIKEKIERSGKDFEELDECKPGLKQGMSVLMPFCVNERNIPQHKLRTAFKGMPKSSECTEGLTQGKGAYKRFCFDEHNNIVQLLHDVKR